MYDELTGDMQDALDDLRRSERLPNVACHIVARALADMPTARRGLVV